MPLEVLPNHTSSDLALVHSFLLKSEDFSETEKIIWLIASHSWTRQEKTLEVFLDFGSMRWNR